MELQERKQKAFSAFMRQMHNIKFESGEMRNTKDRITILFRDGTRVLLQVLTVKGGFAKGEFGAYMGLGIYDGPIYRILDDTRLAGGSIYKKDMIFWETSHSFTMKGSGVYAFRSSDDVDAVVTRMIRDVRRFYVPIVEGFTGKYGEAVNFIISQKGAHVRKPFCMCVILLGLANAFDRLDEVIAAAKENKGFWDFHKTKNYESIVQRVQSGSKSTRKLPERMTR